MEALAVKRDHSVPAAASAAEEEETAEDDERETDDKDEEEEEEEDDDEEDVAVAEIGDVIDDRLLSFDIIGENGTVTDILLLGAGSTGLIETGALPSLIARSISIRVINCSVN